jgi:hypothetical protein
VWVDPERGVNPIGVQSTPVSPLALIAKLDQIIENMETGIWQTKDRFRELEVVYLERVVRSTVKDEQ